MGMIEEDWNYEFDIEECAEVSSNLFELQINNLNISVLKALDHGFTNIIEDKECFARSNAEELKLLQERNKELKQEIETKLKELADQQSHYENVKRDQKLLENEVKETHEAFLMGRKLYKKYLNFYYSIESRSNETELVFIQFFTELKKSAENYSVYLQKNIQSRQYTLQSTNPKLKNFKELQKRLQVTNDVPSILCSIRQAFVALKLTKDLKD